MKKEEKEGKMNLSTLVLFSVMHLVVLMWYIKNLKNMAQIEAEKSVTENFVREKEKWTNKGTDKQYVADSLYTVQLVITKLCTKFQDPRSSSS